MFTFSAFLEDSKSTEHNLQQPSYNNLLYLIDVNEKMFCHFFLIFFTKCIYTDIYES